MCSSDLVSCIPLFKNFIFFVELFAILQLIGGGSCADELELPDSEAAAVTLGQEKKCLVCDRNLTAMLSMGISHPQIVLNVVLCLISLILLCNRRDVELNNRICKDPIKFLL